MPENDFSKDTPQFDTASYSATPILELQSPVYGVIGLIILFVGIQIAWKLTKGRQAVNIQGPYGAGSAASA